MGGRASKVFRSGIQHPNHRCVWCCLGSYWSGPTCLANGCPTGATPPPSTRCPRPGSPPALRACLRPGSAWMTSSAAGGGVMACLGTCLCVCMCSSACVALRVGSRTHKYPIVVLHTYFSLQCRSAHGHRIPAACRAWQRPQGVYTRYDGVFGWIGHTQAGSAPYPGHSAALKNAVPSCHASPHRPCCQPSCPAC